MLIKHLQTHKCALKTKYKQVYTGTCKTHIQIQAMMYSDVNVRMRAHSYPCIYGPTHTYTYVHADSVVHTCTCTARPMHTMHKYTQSCVCKYKYAHPCGCPFTLYRKCHEGKDWGPPAHGCFPDAQLRAWSPEGVGRNIGRQLGQKLRGQMAWWLSKGAFRMVTLGALVSCGVG